MLKVNVNNYLKLLRKELSDHSSEILFGMGVSGMWMTVYLAVKAAPEATKKYEDAKEQKGDSNSIKDEIIPIAAFAKPYIPAAAMGVAATICLLESKSKDLRKNAALAAAYTISETTLEEYQDKVVETVGKKKEQAIRDDIAKDHAQSAPMRFDDIIDTGKGTTLCYDCISHHPFYSSKNAIDKSVNTLNYRLRSEMYISLNDFYYELGLPPFGRTGEDIGWNIDRGEIELDFSSQLSSNGIPMLVIGYSVEPRYDFRTLY